MTVPLTPFGHGGPAVYTAFLGLALACGGPERQADRHEPQPVVRTCGARIERLKRRLRAASDRGWVSHYRAVAGRVPAIPGTIRPIERLGLVVQLRRDGMWFDIAENQERVDWQGFEAQFLPPLREKWAPEKNEKSPPFYIAADRDAPIHLLVGVLARLPEQFEPRLLVRPFADDRYQFAPASGTPRYIHQLTAAHLEQNAPGWEDRLAQAWRRETTECQPSVAMSFRMASSGDKAAFLVRELPRAVRPCCAVTNIEAVEALALVMLDAYAPPVGWIPLPPLDRLRGPDRATVGGLAAGLANPATVDPSTVNRCVDDLNRAADSPSFSPRDVERAVRCFERDGHVGLLVRALELQARRFANTTAGVGAVRRLAEVHESMASIARAADLYEEHGRRGSGTSAADSLRRAVCLHLAYANRPRALGVAKRLAAMRGSRDARPEQYCAETRK